MPRTLMVERRLSWKPRAGADGIYCAPACGRGCKRIEYDAAVAAVDALVKLLGPGWKSRVWENLGWHYEAISKCGRWKLSPSARVGTTAIHFTLFANGGARDIVCRERDAAARLGADEAAVAALPLDIRAFRRVVAKVRRELTAEIARLSALRDGAPKIGQVA
jgi:hypothetical protein